MGVGLDDDLHYVDRMLGVFRERVALQARPVDPRIASWQDHQTDLRVTSWSGPAIDRLTLYTFFAKDRLKEHLCLLWPAADVAIPNLAMVIMEYGPSIIVAADLMPMQDLAWHPGYYDRYMGGYRALVQEWWPRLTAHRAVPDPAPMGYFTGNLGSSLAVLLALTPEAREPGMAFQEAVARCWLDVAAGAEPVPAAEQPAFAARREAFILGAYKALDYASPAAPSLAKNLGWERTNLLFDTVFGEDREPQPLDGPRTYPLPA